MDNQEEKPYIRENIKKKKSKPVKFLIRALECIVFAVIFGLVAAFVFYSVKPYLNKEDIPETPKAVVELPTYTQTTTEEFTTIAPETTEDETETESEIETESVAPSETVFNNDQQSWIEEVVQSMVEAETLGIEDLDREDELILSVARGARDCLVKVKGYKEGSISFETQAITIYHVEESHEVLLLADISAFGEYDELKVSLPAATDKEIDAEVKGSDHVYSLVVLGVSTENLTEAELGRIRIVSLGNNYILNSFDRLVLIGSPYLSGDSVATGRISVIKTDMIAVDSSFRYFGTDINIPSGARGFALNMDGELIGIINTAVKVDYPDGFAAIIGTGDISDTLHVMCNGGTASLMGIYGVSVTKELQESGMPAGVYVKDVQENSPAYDAGISAGDIITAISQTEISDVNKLSKELTGNHLPGETVIVTISRESRNEYKSMTVNVKLGSR